MSLKNSTSIVRLREILSSFHGLKVLVVGDVGIDRYTIGSVERISPEAPVPILWVTEEQHKMGLAANVADNIQALGGYPFLTGVVGKDIQGDAFRKLLKSRKVSDQGLVMDSGRRTIVKERVVSDRQQLLRIDYESPQKIGKAVEKNILKMVGKLLPKADIVILQDYAKGMLTPSLVSAVVALARSKRKAVAVDPNLKSPLSLYRGATFLTPNAKEAEALSGVKITDYESLEAAGARILAGTGAQYVVITRGKDGMAIFYRGKKGASLIPTYAREVFDVSGAGDTVISVMALAMAGGATIEQAAILGNIGAGVVVGKRGTATVDQDEMRAGMDLMEIVKPKGFRAHA